MRLKIQHNMEIAHRLYLDSGKCQQIHGHGMQIALVLLASPGPDGMAVNGASQKLEFGYLKQTFRKYIDSKYDHHLLLNKNDPLAQELYFHGEDWENGKSQLLPGLVTVDGDPTVENLAKWIAEWSCITFECDVICSIDETRTNGAEAMYLWNNFNATFAGGAR